MTTGLSMVLARITPPATEPCCFACCPAALLGQSVQVKVSILVQTIVYKVELGRACICISEIPTSS